MLTELIATIAMRQSSLVDPQLFLQRSVTENAKIATEDILRAKFNH